MVRSHARMSGFTFFEMVVVLGITAIVMSAVIPLFSTNTALAADTRAHQRAEAAHRRNMAGLARVLRGVDIQTLSGFDAEGVATTPAFARVTGADLDDYTYAGDESLRWMPAPIGVDGIDQPGGVYLLRNGKRYLVADRVPAGEFHLRQQGQSLVIHLSTYWVTSARRVVTKTSETVVSVRN